MSDLMLGLSLMLIAFIGIFLSVFNYKRLLILWAIVTIVAFSFSISLLVRYEKIQDSKDKLAHLNECQQISGKYMVINRERVAVGKTSKMVDIYGCVK